MQRALQQQGDKSNDAHRAQNCTTSNWIISKAATVTCRTSRIFHWPKRAWFLPPVFVLLHLLPPSPEQHLTTPTTTVTTHTHTNNNNNNIITTTSSTPLVRRRRNTVKTIRSRFGNTFQLVPPTNTKSKIRKAIARRLASTNNIFPELQLQPTNWISCAYPDPRRRDIHRKLSLGVLRELHLPSVIGAQLENIDEASELRQGLRIDNV